MVNRRGYIGIFVVAVMAAGSLLGTGCNEGENPVEPDIVLLDTANRVVVLRDSAITDSDPWNLYFFG
jgi:hypothetical protein